jgi:AraC family transcriptional regulator
MELCKRPAPAIEGSSFDGLLDRRRLAELLLEASDAIETDHSKAKRYLLHAASLLSGERLPDYSIPKQERGLRSWQVQQIRDFIESKLDTKIRVGDLASRCNLSAGHLNRGFKKAFGQTPLVYIRERRILRAKALMLSSNESLAGIAIACGLCDQAHLSRIFLRIMGETPHAWRRRARNASQLEAVPRSKLTDAEFRQ